MMYYKIIDSIDITKYPHLIGKTGNFFFFLNKLKNDRMKESLNLAKMIRKEEDMGDISMSYDNVYNDLAKKIRSRIEIKWLDTNKLKGSIIKLDVTLEGRDPTLFSFDEKLILKICGHIALFDIYNDRYCNYRYWNEDFSKDDKSKIISKYEYNQELLRILDEDGFLKSE